MWIYYGRVKGKCLKKPSAKSKICNSKKYSMNLVSIKDSSKMKLFDIIWDICSSKQKFEKVQVCAN